MQWWRGGNHRAPNEEESVRNVANTIEWRVDGANGARYIHEAGSQSCECN